ncbi:hypothetical protein [Actinomadura flavalba]|uniref:hypothetical protein n=1 Tax=Actinomadura flavalba TaxID=1120938 RepID=UPI00037ED8C6|nr:hypothetical protein [Actinomadura flavalba]
MPRKLPDWSNTQLVASGAATLAAAVGASYIGVYGTVIGTAFMSVVSTAGAVVGKYYLDQGKQQIKERGHLGASAEARRDAVDAMAEATSADPTRRAGAAHVGGGDPNATRLDASGGDPNATRVDLHALGGDPNATRVDRPAAETVADHLAAEAGEESQREAARKAAWANTVAWARRHWLRLAASAATVFVLVLGTITVWELVAGGIGEGGEKGPTVVRVFGGDTDRAPTTPTPSVTRDDGPAPTQSPTGTQETPGPETSAPATRTPSTTPSTQAPPTTAPTTPRPTPTQEAPTTGPTGSQDRPAAPEE